MYPLSLRIQVDPSSRPPPLSDSVITSPIPAPSSSHSPPKHLAAIPNAKPLPKEQTADSSSTTPPATYIPDTIDKQRHKALPQLSDIPKDQKTDTLSASSSSSSSSSHSAANATNSITICTIPDTTDKQRHNALPQLSEVPISALIAEEAISIPPNPHGSPQAATNQRKVALDHLPAGIMTLPPANGAERSGSKHSSQV